MEQAKEKQGASTITSPQSEEAKKLIANADTVLAEVDGSHVFKAQAARDFPSFDEEEIQCGRKLGTGGFSNVFEVSKITLNIPSKADDGSCDSEDPDNFDVENLMGGADEEHYEVDKAKDLMAERFLRNKSARYAVKRLRKDLNEIDHARGMIDLAIEIKFMSVICHPNIGTFRLTFLNDNNVVYRGASPSRSFFI
jgi:hypothetical protein